MAKKKLPTMFHEHIFCYGSNNYGVEEKLIKRPVKKEITNSIWQIIERRLKTKHNPSGNYGNNGFSDNDGYYERSGFIRETDEYGCDDIATAILKYSKKKGIKIPFGLTVSKNYNVVLYKKIEKPINNK